ncbi:hypothetical protein ACSBR2_039489 [Camellia fascicularis]
MTLALNNYIATGMPTVATLKVMVKKMGLPDGLDSGTSKGYGDVLRCCRTWSKIEKQIATLEFDRDRKLMGVIGAVENVLEQSSFVQLWDNIGLKQCGKNCKLRWLNYLRPYIKRDFSSIKGELGAKDKRGGSSERKGKETKREWESLECIYFSKW